MKSPQEELFNRAVLAIIEGDAEQLKALLAKNPTLIQLRSSGSHRATLLHYITANGVEDSFQKTPQNAVEIAEILLQAGAEIEARIEAWGQEQARLSTPLISLISSYPPTQMGVKLGLMDVFLNAGAKLEGLAGDGAPLATAIAFGYAEAATYLCERGAKLHTLGMAAALGELEVMKTRLEADEPEAIGFMKLGCSKQERLDWAFIYACMHKRLKAANYLLEQGASINAQGIQGMTALHYSVWNDQEEVFQFLMEKKPGLEIKNDYGGTVLDFLVWLIHEQPNPKLRRIPYVYRLILAGADLDAVTPFPGTDPELKRILLFYKALALMNADDLTGLKVLLTDYPWLVRIQIGNPYPPYDGYFAHATLLHHLMGNPELATLPENTVEMIKELVLAGAEIDAPSGQDSDWSWTPLALVASGSQAWNQQLAIPMMETLIQAGADINWGNGIVLYGAFSHTGENPRQQVIGQWLHAHGAELDLAYAAAIGALEEMKHFRTPNAKLVKGAYRLFRPAMNRMSAPTDTEILSEALVWAALNGQVETAKTLLEWGAPINGTTSLHREFPTPLHAAVLGDWFEMVQLLVEAGADINLQDQVHDCSAVYWAKFLGKKKLLYFFMAWQKYFDLDNAVHFNKTELALAQLQAGANPNGQRNKGIPLRVAAYHGNLQILEALLVAGADKRLANAEGKTALDYARIRHHTALIERLTQ